MKSHEKKKSLSTQLAITCAVILIVLNTVAVFVLSFLVGGTLSDQKDDYFDSVVTGVSKQVENEIDGFVMVAEILANQPDLARDVANSNEEAPFSTQDSHSFVTDYMDNAMTDFPSILNFAVGVAGEDTVYLNNGNALDNYSLQASVISQSMSTNDTIITQPYLDALTGDMVVSISAPIMYSGRSVGLVVIDLNLASLSHTLSDSAFGDTGIVFMISEDLTIIGHGDSSLIGKNLANVINIDENMQTELDNPTGETISYIYNDTPTHAQISSTKFGWIVFARMSTSEYNMVINSTIFNMSLLVGVVILITAISLFIIIKNKLKPINDVNNIVEKMSQGDLSFSVEDNNGKIKEDEITAMVSSLRNTSQILSTYIHKIDDVMIGLASGDLSANIDIDFMGDFASIKSSIEEFTINNQNLISNITGVANQLYLTANQVQSGSAVLADGAIEQNVSIDQLVSSIAVISQGLEESVVTAQQAKREVDISEKSINVCRVQMESLEAAMENVNEKSIQIRGIIKTIEDIAFQTNILALNAAVEAARAGNAGKGFAVVADEVRNLASKSSEASTAISNLIQSTIVTVDQGISATQQTSKSVADLIESSSNVVKMVDQINENSQSQNQAMKGLTANVDLISSVVQSTAATAEESAAASNELNNQSQSLKSLISRFDGASLPSGNAVLTGNVNTPKSIPTNNPKMLGDKY